MTIQQSRGRPRGTGKNDEPTLAAIADLLVANSSLKPTTAIKRLLGRPTEAVVRRLQIKWKAHRDRLLRGAEARRYKSAEFPLIASGETRIPHIMQAAMETARQIDALLHSPSMRAMRDLYDSPSMRLTREVYNHPAMRLAREMNDSPSMKLARQIHDSPALRLAREMHDSPTMRLARDVHERASRLLLGKR